MEFFFQVSHAKFLQVIIDRLNWKIMLIMGCFHKVGLHWKQWISWWFLLLRCVDTNPVFSVTPQTAKLNTFGFKSLNAASCPAYCNCQNCRQLYFLFYWKQWCHSPAPVTPHHNLSRSWHADDNDNDWKLTCVSLHSLKPSAAPSQQPSKQQ